jgi:hypothetical protein
VTSSAPDDVERIGRFEWERLVRRARLGSSTKLVAFTLAQYGNRDGSSCHPGLERLAATTELHERTVRRGLEQLRRAGFVDRVFRGSLAGRQRLADTYCLTVPVDLLDRLEMLDPNERTVDTRPSDRLGITGH